MKNKGRTTPEVPQQRFDANFVLDILAEDEIFNFIFLEKGKEYEFMECVDYLDDQGDVERLASLLPQVVNVTEQFKNLPGFMAFDDLGDIREVWIGRFPDGSYLGFYIDVNDKGEIITAPDFTSIAEGLIHLIHENGALTHEEVEIERIRKAESQKALEVRLIEDRKKRLWDERITHEFFKVFGDPLNISLEDGADHAGILLQYPAPFGFKKVTPTELAMTRHFPLEPLTESKCEGGYFVACFTFPNIPSSRVWLKVATLSYPQTRLWPFEILSEAVQRELIESLKQNIELPDSIAKKDLDHLIKDLEHRITPLREELVDLQRQGDHCLKQKLRTIAVQSQGKSTSYSGDEMRGGSYDSPGWGTFSEPGSGIASFYSPAFITESWHRFGKIYFSEPEDPSNPQHAAFAMDEDVEKVRTRLVQAREKALIALLQPPKKEPIPSDTRLYNLSPEEWLITYHKAYEAALNQMLTHWKEETSTFLIKINAEWQGYKSVKDEYLSILQKVSQLEMQEEAQPTGIDFSTLGKPFTTNFAEADLAVIRQAINDFTSYFERLQQEILVRREARNISNAPLVSSKAQEQLPATPAPWYLFDIQAEDLERRYGRTKGEGFGDQGREGKYLPGARGIVAMSFPELGKRYSRTVTTHGLTTIESPDASSRRAFDLVGAIEKNTWNVLVVKSFDGDPQDYTIATAQGIGFWHTWDDEITYSSQDWEGNEGQGPSQKEARELIFGAPAVPHKEAIKPSSGPAANRDTLRDKFRRGKK